jgi:predicted PurR-regulated permease PerM
MLNSSTENRFREKYWLVSLIVLVVVLGMINIYSLWPYLGSVLGAFTLYVLVRGQLLWLTGKKKIGKKLAASMLLLEVTIFFLIPVVAVVLLLINKLQNTAIDLSFLIKEMDDYLQIIKDKTGFDLLNASAIGSIPKITGQILQLLLSGVSSLFINVILLIFVLYFMLVSQKEVEKYMYDLLPFRDENKKIMLHEARVIINSNAFGIPLLALIQGGFAYVGYLIFGVDEPFLYALFTSFATIIPIFGTALVWVPVCIFLFISKDWGNAIGLTLYCLLVISNVDNVARLILQKKMGDIHPLITVFGVLVGLYVFGFWGIIFGPLILSLFCLFVDFFKKEYIDKPNAAGGVDYASEANLSKEPKS